MNTRDERLRELVRIIFETNFEPEQPCATLEEMAREMPILFKQLNSLLDEEFLAGYDYALDPTAAVLPRRTNARQFYGEQRKRGPGRPRKNPELPPRPAGRHVNSEGSAD